jgi:hypothetical protein
MTPGNYEKAQQHCNGLQFWLHALVHVCMALPCIYAHPSLHPWPACYPPPNTLDALHFSAAELTVLIGSSLMSDPYYEVNSVGCEALVAFSGGCLMGACQVLLLVVEVLAELAWTLLIGFSEGQSISHLLECWLLFHCFWACGLFSFHGHVQCLLACVIGCMILQSCMFTLLMCITAMTADALGLRLQPVSKQLVAATLPLTTAKRHKLRIAAVQAVRAIMHQVRLNVPCSWQLL